MKIQAFVLSACALAATCAEAEFKFADVLTDHAVLQRDLAAPVWGEANPGDVVVVSLNGKKVGESVADKDGRWLVKLPPQKANRNPGEIAAVCGGKSVKIGDILFGDVWFGCGQSNMAFMLKECRPGWREMTADDLDGIRCLKIRPDCFCGEQRSFAGQWLPASESRGEISGCGFFFN